MFCHECGKEIPDGAKFCNYCGEAQPQTGPRHARPEPEFEEISSFSDNRDYEERVKLYQPVEDRYSDDATRVYHFKNFEGYNEPVPQDDVDDREFIDDSYDNYSDDEDDRTFMDKLDDKFRRDDYRLKKQNNMLWVWILLSAVVVIIVALIIVLAVNSNSTKKNTKPTTAPTALPTKVVATEPDEIQEQEPVETWAPEEWTPETEAPAPNDPPETEAPQVITEAPMPTDPPVEETEPPVDDELFESNEENEELVYVYEQPY